MGARPNQRFHLTPRRGPLIGGILKSALRSMVLPIYWCGAGEAHAVGVRRYKPAEWKG